MTEKPKTPSRGKKPPRGPKVQPNLGGRPEHQPTIETRTIVEQMKFCGEANAVIARSLQIDPDTLAKHYAFELESGHANRRKEIIGLLFKEANNGNVSAIKRLEEMGRIAAAAEKINGRAPKEPDLGKKEERQAAAERIAGKYAVPAGPPKLVVSNP